MKNQPMASPEMIGRLRAILQETEQEFIMIQLRLSGAGWINIAHYDHPVIINASRNKVIVGRIMAGIKYLRLLLARDESYITVRRVNAIRQKYYMLMYRNQDHAAWDPRWEEKSGNYIAGSFLYGVFVRHLPITKC